MDTVSPSSLLRTWEAQRHAHPVRRALGLLDTASPDGGAWPRASVGRRDAALLRLHRRWFGATLRTIARCPRCGERLQTEFDIDALGLPDAALADDPATRCRLGAYEVEFRLPSSDDLLQVIEDPAPAADPVRALLGRCIAQARLDAQEIPADALPPGLVAALEDEMARLDPAADLRADLRCAACGHDWPAHLDVVGYLLAEVDDWALRTLADVHVLARAYGWSEEAILALSADRRQTYVDMVLA